MQTILTERVIVKDVRNALLATAAMIVAVSAPAHALLFNASYTLAGGGVVDQLSISMCVNLFEPCLGTTLGGALPASMVN